jgi:hypothetical protein
MHFLKIGIETATFSKPRTPDVMVAEAVAKLIERIGKWPTEDEFAREKKTDPSFPSLKVIRRIKR